MTFHPHLKRSITRRLVVATACVLVPATLTLGASTWASPTPTPSKSTSSTSRGISPAPPKVKAGSTWTLNRIGTGCENDTFAGHGRFSAVVTDESGDGGTFKGTKKLTMSWRRGLADGAVFHGRWSKATGDYTGIYSLGNQVVSATLQPYVSGTCLSTTSMTAGPSATTVVLGGAGVTDGATVYGSGGIAPTGTVAFYVCPGDTHPCTAAAATLGGTTLAPVALVAVGSAAKARSAAYLPTATGTDCFLAVYSGDNNYATSADGTTTDQCFTVVTQTAASN